MTLTTEDELVICTRCKEAKWPVQFALKGGRRRPRCKQCERETDHNRRLLYSGRPVSADPIMIPKSPRVASPVARVESTTRTRVRALTGGAAIAKPVEPSVMAWPDRQTTDYTVKDGDLELLAAAVEFCGGDIEPRLSMRMMSAHGWPAHRTYAVLAALRAVG